MTLRTRILAGAGSLALVTLAALAIAGGAGAVTGFFTGLIAMAAGAA